jgi:benzylsuccinate CoA-transferase BbsF subunit
MTKQALEGVKVLDFCWATAGPMVTTYLGYNGAEVINIETRTKTSLTRASPPFAPGDAYRGDRSGFFANSGGAGKKGITLNLSHPRGKEVARKLVAWADVVTENFSGGQMAKWGLAYEDIKKIKPDIIMLSFSMYGQTGPFSAVPGFAGTLISVSGITSLTGKPGGESRAPVAPYTDFISPRIATMALIAALDYRNRTGQGQYIDLAQQEVMLNFVSPALLKFEADKVVLSRIGNRSTYAAPHGVYKCKGKFRWCTITVFTDKDWKNFCKVVNKPEWVKDARFGTLTDRLKNVDELDKLVEEWTLGYTPEEVLELMQKGGVASGVVKNGQDVFNDPQMNSRGFYTPIDHPALGKFSYSGSPVKFSKTPYTAKRSSCLGEYNYEVYTKIVGMSDEEFVQSLSDGLFE